MSSVAIILYKSKKLKNGQHPIMIRIIKDRKPVYKSTGYTSLPEHWDFEKELPNRKHPSYKELSIYIQAKKADAESEKLTLEKENRDYSPSDIIEVIKPKAAKKDVFSFIDYVIEEMNTAGRVGNAEAYRDSKRALTRFTGNSSVLLFSNTDVAFLRKFEAFLLSTGVKESTVAAYMRSLRALFNRAIQEKVVRKELYPFDEYKISKLNIQPNHRALDKTKIEQIFNYAPREGRAEHRSLNLFKFSYYCWGINLIDMAQLKWKNIQEGRLIYRRSKTGKLYNIPLVEPAQNILNYYKSHLMTKGAEDYIFPILDREKHKTPQQVKDRVKKVTKQTNKDLKAIAVTIGIDEKITTYVARHSFATNLRNLNVSTSKIQNMLGHTTEKTTQGYLNSFKNDELDEATKLLL
ncbi:MAG TPA: site-specific integrase [Cytophagales bacterium]|nr:site-specific integrase [Cytophagales bacterium]